MNKQNTFNDFRFEIRQERVRINAIYDPILLRYDYIIIHESGEIIETLPELDGYKRQMCSPLPEYETDALVKQIKCRRPFFFISGLFIAYTLISFIVWLITIIYLKLSGMGTAISVRYNSIDGWDLSHPVWVSVIMVNLVIVFYIFFGMTILNIIKKFIIVIIKTYYKYKEEK